MLNPVWMQCKAEILRIFRNPYFVFWSLFMPILFYFLFTNVFNVGMGDEWHAHFLMSVTCFSVMGSAIMTLGIRLVEERTKGWSMFMRLTPLSDGAYFFTKMVGQTMIHIFSIIIIFTVGSFINNVTLTISQWLLCGMWILLGSFPFLALGTLVGLMKKVDTASGVSNVIYMGLAILGGMWMPMEIMPKFIQSIAQWIPSFHFGSGAWEMVRGNAPSLVNISVLIGYLIVFVVLSIYIRRKQEVVV